MDIWIVIDQDRHDDPQAYPFSTEEAAIAYARELAGDLSLPAGTDPEHVEHVPGEREITPELRQAGLVYDAIYSIEGDRIRVEQCTLDAQP